MTTPLRSNKVRVALAALLLGLFANRSAAAASQAAGGLPVRVERSATAHDARSVEILSIAYESASMMPHRPHIKTRSRLQEEAVVALLQSGGSEEVAADWADGIDSWRRGLAYAAIASHLAATADAASARRALEVAESVERSMTAESEQGWRRDRVRVGIAEAHARLGDLARAAEIQSRVDPSEGGELAVLAATLVDESEIDGQVSVLQAIAENGSMDQVRHALRAIAHFYGRVYADVERRDAMEAAVRVGWDKLPLQPRIELLEILVGHDIANGNRAKARATTDDIEALVVGNTFNLEEQIALRAKVASLRARSGDREAGLKVADDALARYDELGESIVSIWRGRALRPLAAAYAELGESMTANDLLERALVEAVVNPNSRPRVEDLVATCITITRGGIEPRESLIKALSRTRAALGAPW